ncbi:hypothetical protein ACFL6S_21615 [Candidatus Poribacteria bacterium]
MLNGRDFSNLQELLAEMGRTNVKIVRIDAPGIGNADFLDTEEISVVRNGVVETRMTEHARLLDCGHLGKISSLVAVCDLCARLCCEECLAQCQECGFLTCRYCRRRRPGSGGHERILCAPCSSRENRRRAARTVSRTIAGFFVRKEKV